MADIPHRSRRDFLFGRAIIRSVRGVAADAAEGDASGGLTHPSEPRASHSERDSWLLEFTRQAMACRWQILLNSDGVTIGPEAAVDTLEHLEELENQWSVYREHSLMSRVNREASEREVIVDEDLFELLRLGQRIHEMTDGAFDMTAGPLTKAWGFYRREGTFPSAEQLAEALAVVGTRWVELNPATRAVRYSRPGMEINLGGIGKGFALDLCSARLRAWGVSDFLFHGGQSSVVARGRRSAVARGDAAGWRVGLSHPIWPGVRLAEFDLCDQALGTSGTGRQFFYHQGRRYGHILDPRNGMPTDTMLSATVIAPTAAEADAIATACHVMGVERSIELIESRPDFAALFVLPGKTREQVDLLPVALAEHQWRIVEKD
ncbi:MAG: FAD:protein FMN transferase [Planctomycetales bacterium]|nr:FAD:protein FMN transferase [Planctomycetales bacterium]